MFACVPGEVLRDFFGGEMNKDERHLIVDANLDAFRSIISEKYAHRDHSFYEQDNRRHPYVVVSEDDMHQSGLEFRADVLDLRQASFFGR